MVLATPKGVAPCGQWLPNWLASSGECHRAAGCGGASADRRPEEQHRECRETPARRRCRHPARTSVGPGDRAPIVVAALALLETRANVRRHDHQCSPQRGTLQSPRVGRSHLLPTHTSRGSKRRRLCVISRERRNPVDHHRARRVWRRRTLSRELISMSFDKRPVKPHLRALLLSTHCNEACQASHRAKLDAPCRELGINVAPINERHDDDRRRAGPTYPRASYQDYLRVRTARQRTLPAWSRLLRGSDEKGRRYPFGRRERFSVMNPPSEPRPPPLASSLRRARRLRAPVADRQVPRLAR